MAFLSLYDSLQLFLEGPTCLLDVILTEVGPCKLDAQDINRNILFCSECIFDVVGDIIDTQIRDVMFSETVGHACPKR